jgi:hypothetical protein
LSNNSYGLSTEIAVLDRKLAYLPSGDPHGWNGEPCASMDIRGFSHGASPVEAPLGDPDVVRQSDQRHSQNHCEAKREADLFSRPGMNAI